MSKVVIAEQPNLSFILTNRLRNEKNGCPFPFILSAEGHFDWEANEFITKLGGGAEVYNVKPLATTMVKKAYSLNLFCDFLESKFIKNNNINDSSLYLFVESLKNRGINDSTIISHVRLALGYVVHLSNKYAEWMLATKNNEQERGYNTHYEVRTYKSGRIEKEYLYHRCLDGLINISSEAEIVHDYELIKWLDAINCTSHHPKPSEFIQSRWQAFTTLLEITGSRITEVHGITRSMIKTAAQNLLDSEKLPVIRGIPIIKGKFKGKTRQVKTTNEDLQVLLMHVNMIEKKFPKIRHDAMFVDADDGNPLKASYLKNYAKKVINGSSYKRELRNLTNHSFRHRFITLYIAKALKRLSSSGSFSNILKVASTECRKITMHASDATLARYVHLATELNHETNLLSDSLQHESSQVRARILKLLSINGQLKANQISKQQAFESMLTHIGELAQFQLK